MSCTVVALDNFKEVPDLKPTETVVVETMPGNFKKLAKSGLYFYSCAWCFFTGNENTGPPGISLYFRQ